MCNEAVTWTVFETPIKVSSSQVAELNKWPAGYLSGNNRSPLPLNGRKVSYYGLNDERDIEPDVVPDSDYKDVIEEIDEDYNNFENSTEINDYGSNETDTTSTEEVPEDDGSSSSSMNTFTLITFLTTVLLLF